MLGYNSLICKYRQGKLLVLIFHVRAHYCPKHNAEEMLKLGRLREIWITVTHYEGGKRVISFFYFSSGC